MTPPHGSTDESAQDFVRVIAAWCARDLCSSILQTDDQRAVFEACNGKRLGKDIAQATGVSPASVSTWSKRWRELGLVIENDLGFLQHQFSLSSLGIPEQLDTE